MHHWHITSQKCLHLIEEEDVELIPSKNGHTFIERPYRNQVFCIDYKPDGAKFATAGKDYKVQALPAACCLLRAACCVPPPPALPQRMSCGTVAVRAA